MRILREFFREMGREETDARMRMARIPEGAELIPNPVTKAPGFHIGNVLVMAGVPKIMQAMLDQIDARLERGRPVQSVSIEAMIPEGDLGDPLKEIAQRHPEVSIGSYPFMEGGRFGARIVIRSRDEAALKATGEEVRRLVEKLSQSVASPPRTWE